MGGTVGGFETDGGTSVYAGSSSSGYESMSPRKAADEDEAASFGSSV